MTEQPTFVTFKWRPFEGYRSTFKAEHVNTWGRMIDRCYRKPHRKACVTDDPEGIDPSIEVVPLWSDFADLMSPHGARFPSCYCRLKLFARDAAQTFGPIIVQSDLDAVFVADDSEDGSLAPLVDRPEDFVAWGDTGPGKWAGNYNGSFYRLRAGSRPQVWEDFDPSSSPRLAQESHCLGSDQGWITYRLGKGVEPKYHREDGVYSYQNDIRKTQDRLLPDNARAVFFHGRVDPWHLEARMLPWVQRNYR